MNLSSSNPRCSRVNCNKNRRRLNVIDNEPFKDVPLIGANISDGSQSKKWLYYFMLLLFPSESYNRNQTVDYSVWYELNSNMLSPILKGRWETQVYLLTSFSAFPALHSNCYHFTLTESITYRSLLLFFF